MEKRTYTVNSKLLPPNFPREFDAHVYFNESTEGVASELRDEALKFFHGEKVFVGQMIPEPIGPHPLPMFEMNFPKEMFTEVVLWLMHRRGDLSILVHELTGDDYYDHTQAALWLGAEVPLAYGVFKK